MKWAVPPSAPALLVSDTGRMIRMASSRRKGKGWQTFPEAELRPRIVGAGYLGIQCKIAGERLDRYVHRLVAEAFLGRHPDKREVNHIDGDKTNNNLANLEWVTHSENHRHAARHGMSPVTTLHPDQVRLIRVQLDSGITMQVIADRHGVTRSTVNHIKHGRCWAWLDQQVTGSKG